MQTALLMVDVQNDYFPGGKNELAGPIEAGRNAGKLLGAFRERRMPAVHVRHVSVRPGATFFLPGTPGAEIRDEVRPLAGETVIVKHHPNSFRETELLARLRETEVGRLVACGMMTHMCVDSTVRAAYDHGFEVVLAGDACATKDLAFDGRTVAAEDVQRAFLSAINGTFAKVATTELILNTIR